MMRAPRHVAGRWCASAAVALVVTGCGGGARPAPATAILPLAPGAHVVLSLPGPSDVDSAHDRKRYRYMAISGARRESPTRFLLAEVRALHNAGWSHQLAWIIREDSGHAVRTSPVTHGATVQLDRRKSEPSVYVEMELLDRRADLAETTSGDPRYPVGRKIALALSHDEPVLDILLAQRDGAAAQLIRSGPRTERIGHPQYLHFPGIRPDGGRPRASRGELTVGGRTRFEVVT